MALITVENARQLSAKSKAARAANTERRKNIEKQVAVLDAKILAMTANADRIASERLIRVRKQLAMVDTRIEEEASKDGTRVTPNGLPILCDGQLLNWLCSAQERLSEQERVLSGRPLPGTLKPTSKPPRLMLSPAVDAGHAQTLATPTQASQPASEPPSDIPPAENS